MSGGWVGGEGLCGITAVAVAPAVVAPPPLKAALAQLKWLHTVEEELKQGQQNKTVKTVRSK